MLLGTVPEPEAYGAWDLVCRLLLIWAIFFRVDHRIMEPRTVHNLSLIILFVSALSWCAERALAQSCIQAPSNIIFQNDVQVNCTISGFSNKTDTLCSEAQELQLLACPAGGPWTSLKQQFWQDIDQDGYGNPAQPAFFCGPLPPTQYATNDLDCDDTDETIFPGSVACLSDTSNTYNLQTLWPARFNITIPSTLCNAGANNNTMNWGHGITIHGDFLFQGASCSNMGMLWRFDTNAQGWIPLRNFTFPPLDTPAAVTQYANTGSLYNAASSPKTKSKVAYLSITYGHSTTFIPNRVYDVFDLWYWSNIETAPSSPVQVDTSASILRGVGGPGSFHVFSGVNQGGSMAFTVGGNPGPGIALIGGNVNDSRAALGTVSGAVYNEWSLCNCSSPFKCPTGWTFGGGFTTFCTATNNQLGWVSAIDRFDGSWAAVGHQILGGTTLDLFMFWFNQTDGQWWLKQTLTGPSMTPGALSLGLYNGLLVIGNRNGNLADISPSLVHNASVCDGVEVGWARYATLSGFTWTLQSSFLYDPDACTGDFCAESVAVNSNNRVLLGCPQYLEKAGSAYGKALVFDISNVAYPNLVAQYVAPSGQFGIGMAEVSFAQFVAMDESRILFSTDFVAVQGYSQIGRAWVTRCTNHSTCPVPVVPVP